MAHPHGGRVFIQRVIDFDPFALGLDFLFPGATLAALADWRNTLAGTHVDWTNAAVLLAVQSHLVRFGGKTILIDTCVGEHKERPARPEWHRRAGGAYLANLAACPCAPEDVDFVMCTHLHADHVGWNTRLDSGEWVPTFPNARYLMSKVEADQRAAEVVAKPQANHGSFQDSVLPIIARGLADFVAPGDHIVDGAAILALPGHTPGQIGLELDDGSAGRVIFCGDAIHNPLQVFRPEWSSAFCHDRAQAVATRRSLLARAAAEDLRLVPNHLRGRDMRIRAQKTGFVPIFEG